MPQIKVNTQALKVTADKYRFSSLILLLQASSLRKIGNNLPFSDNISAEIKIALEKCCKNVLSSRKRVDRMSKALDEASDLYFLAEEKRYTAGMDPLEYFLYRLMRTLINPLGVFKGTDSSFKNNSFLIPGANREGQGLLDPLKVEGEWAALSGRVDGSTSFFGIPISGGAYGALLYAKGKAEVKSGMEFDENGNIDFLGIKAEASGEFSAARGKLNGSIGDLYGELEGSVLNASAKGEVGATLFKDGKLDPRIYAGVEGKANVAEGTAKIGLGNDVNGSELEAHGEVLTAKGNAEAGVGRITIKDENGHESTHYGAIAEVGGEAYVAKGSVGGTTSIFGIKITAEVGGGVGGVGGKVGGYVTTDGVQGSFGLGLGVGADVKLGIDWSGFNPGAIVDSVVDFGKSVVDVGNAVAGAVDGFGKWVSGFF